jgi:hypothetical protein
VSSYGVANAFPSMAKWALDDAINAAGFDSDDASFLCRRHADALVLLTDGQTRRVCCKPGCGDQQGDVGAPTKFILAYDPRVEASLKRNFYMYTNHFLVLLLASHIVLLLMIMFVSVYVCMHMQPRPVSTSGTPHFLVI